MSVNVNLKRAKDGNKNAYGLLCNEFADRLYAIAFLVLDNSEDAETVLRNALDDGFKAIGRINDENHLCAWLSRELTKHIVAKLKEYRADGKTVSGGDVPEKVIFCRLNDLDRLVCSLNLAFDYKLREISVITGLKEETAERKLNDSDKKLGKDKPKVKAYIETVKAPDSLITKPPKVHDLTVEIDKADDDELIGEMERIAAFAEAAEKGDIPEEKPVEKPRIIKFDPSRNETETENSSEQSVKSEKAIKIKFGDISEPVPVKMAESIEEKHISPAPEKEPEPIQEEKTEPVAAETSVKEEKKAVPVVTEKPITEEKKPEPVSEKKPIKAAEVNPEPVKEEVKAPASKKEIDAKTFINVITAQRIKGSEFLKLMGNTRISNSAYREIEQNPNLTKDRLVELLEESSLTSEDYYKVLTAVKQRSEMLAKKEEAKKRLEEAGLFTPPGRRAKEPEPETDALASDTRSFSVTETPKEEKAEKPEPVLEKPKLEAKNSDTMNIPYVPDISPVVNDEPYEDDEDEPVAEKPVQQSVKKEEPEQQTGRREKYKGREYFIDDDVYYPGVNNGKLIFAAVCAVLLIGGSFGIRYLVTGNPLPTDTPGSVSAEAETPKLPTEYLSNDDIYTAITMLEAKSDRKTAGYLKSDGEGYSEIITKEYAEKGSKIYNAVDGKILIYDLSSDNPNLFSELAIDETRDFIGFIPADNGIYMLYSDKYSETVAYTVTKTADDGTATTEELTKEIKRPRVTAEFYENNELSYTYSQDGNFTGVKLNESSLTIATILGTSPAPVKEAPKTYLPTYSLNGETASVNFDSITVPSEIEYNSFTVIGTASGTEARVYGILGGSDSYVDFNGDECTVIMPDKNKTLSEKFRFIGSSLEKASSEIYTGECFGVDCINGDGTVITAYDSANGCILVQKKNGEEYVSIGGIGVGETPESVTYTDKNAYIITGTADGKDKLYSVDISGTELIHATADASVVYSDKLKAYGDELLGVTVEADADGNRTGLKLTVYSYENGLKEKRSALITLDENTDDEYLKYLTSDAETNNLRIASDKESGYIALSTVYFDGISEIERILCYKDSGASLDVTTDLLLFDVRSDYRLLSFHNNSLYIITNASVITVDPETGSPTGYFEE